MCSKKVKTIAGISAAVVAVVIIIIIQISMSKNPADNGGGNIPDNNALRARLLNSL